MEKSANYATGLALDFGDRFFGEVLADFSGEHVLMDAEQVGFSFRRTPAGEIMDRGIGLLASMKGALIEYQALRLSRQERLPGLDLLPQVKSPLPGRTQRQIILKRRGN